jgi:hypothetical protein
MLKRLRAWRQKRRDMHRLYHLLTEHRHLAHYPLDQWQMMIDAWVELPQLPYSLLNTQGEEIARGTQRMRLRHDARGPALVPANMKGTITYLCQEPTKTLEVAGLVLDFGMIRTGTVAKPDGVVRLHFNDSVEFTATFLFPSVQGIIG